MANISFTQQNMTTYRGYFYMFDQTVDMLFQKTDDGITAFSYPMDTVLSNTIFQLEYDGVNFWTLENPDTEDIIIRRWKIENYICKLKNTFEYTMNISDRFDSKAMTVEHYHTTVTGTVHPPGSTIIGVEPGYGLQLTGNMYITLGPNKDGLSETIQVQGSADGVITLAAPTTLEYGLHPGGALYEPNSRSGVQFYTYIWFFNNYYGLVSSTGALYKVNAYASDSIHTRYPGGAYKAVTACTFYKVGSFLDEYGVPMQVDTLAYVKSRNLLFIDVSGEGSELPYYGSMVMDNGTTAIDDIAMYDENIYRLQGANYALSTLESFVSSIALVASPAIITAVQSSTTTIDAYVKDQFFQPVASRQVTFSDDDDVGTIISDPTPNTDGLGKASVVYQAGTEARVVTITATVQQV